MSARTILIALAVVLALGASVYLGMKAGAPKVAAPEGTPGSAGKAVASARPDQKVPSRPFKRTPTPNSATTAAAPSQPAMSPEEILAALQQLDLVPNNPIKLKKREELVALLAALDPLRALTYVDTFTGEERYQQRADVFGIWAGKDPIAASAYFWEHYVAEDYLGAAAIAQAWAEKDTAAAWTWVASLPDGARSGATPAVVARMAANDPVAALGAVKSLTADWERAEAMQPLAVEWGKSAPTVAAAWVAGLKDESEKSYAASGLITGWMTTNPRSASEWVSHLPQGNARDSAILAMVDAPTSMKNPEAALTWAAGIQNVELRNQTLPQVLKKWQVQDPAGAANFIAKHSKK